MVFEETGLFFYFKKKSLVKLQAEMKTEKDERNGTRNRSSRCWSLRVGMPWKRNGKKNKLISDPSIISSRPFFTYHQEQVAMEGAHAEGVQVTRKEERAGLFPFLFPFQFLILILLLQVEANLFPQVLLVLPEPPFLFQLEE